MYSKLLRYKYKCVLCVYVKVCTYVYAFGINIWSHNYAVEHVYVNVIFNTEHAVDVCVCVCVCVVRARARA